MKSNTTKQLKTRYCDTCAHSGWDDATETFLCAKGHKPRWYKPKNGDWSGDLTWGYKRRCEDFELRRCGCDFLLTRRVFGSTIYSQ